jgi:hypothetical protein
MVEDEHRWLLHNLRKHTQDYTMPQPRRPQYKSILKFYWLFQLLYPEQGILNISIYGCTALVDHGRFFSFLIHTQLITVAPRSKAWTVFARWNTGVVGLKPTRGMDVCVRLFCVCVVLCVGTDLATSWSPVQGVLPTVQRIKKLKKRPRSNKEL